MTTTGESPRVSLRPVGPGDAEFLLDVYGSTRADEMALVSWWTDEQRRAFLKSQLDAQRGEYEKRFPAADYSVILVDDAPAGRLWIARTPEQIRLLDIALLPAFRRRGIGATLLGRLIEESEETGRPLRHMVFELNPEAVRFYRRLGFALLEQHGAYLEMERVPAGAGGGVGGGGASPAGAGG
jgi:ribosomal protein S18 acetylase RimI-like enzyme